MRRWPYATQDLRRNLRLTANLTAKPDGREREQRHPANAETIGFLKKTIGREHAGSALSFS